MDALQDEVDSLEAILMDDVIIRRNEKSVVEAIETTVLPVIGEDSEQQYVCVTLQVLPQVGYPDVSPEFKLLRPRGLDDATLDAIKSACNAKLQESIGFPVVFDLIEVIREHLTVSNLPSGQCVICLYGFTDGDEFTRTECFHYLHSYCLSRHLNAMRRNYNEEFDKLPSWLQKTADPFQATCPVCREPIKDESDSLKCAMPPTELQNAPEFQLTQELRNLQQRMSDLFLQQKSRGAIIDIEAESGTVISIESEQEIRRRRSQRKTHDESQAAQQSTGNSEANVNGGDGGGSGSAIFKSPPRAVEQNNSTSAKASGSSNAFGSLVQPAVRQTANVEPTNNNYNHHNRRHYHRGGRRHQHHFHQPRDRDRERERFEYHHNHSSSSTSATASSHHHNQQHQHHSTDVPATSATASATHQPNHGKQHKSHASSAANSR